MKVFEPNGAVFRTFLATREREINSSFPALAPPPGGRFVLIWAQRSSESFDNSTSVKAKIFSADRGAVGQEIKVNTSTGGFVRVSVCAAATFRRAASDFLFVAWTEMDPTRGGFFHDLAMFSQGQINA